MNEMLNQESIWRGTEFWTKEIEKAGLLNNLKFFNDVIVEKCPPHPESEYGEPILIDVVLDGKKTDIYHTDKDNKDTFHRLFLHIKE